MKSYSTIRDWIKTADSAVQSAEFTLLSEKLTQARGIDKPSAEIAKATKSWRG
jgi:hypothetical protein